MTAMAGRRATDWPLLVPPTTESSSRGPVPTFSIVIPAYNVAHLIGETVASALAQSVAPLEVIVVDDGSTDDLQNALAPYRDRITLIQKPNGGEASARNVGAQAASGDFVAWIDGDDKIAPQRIEAFGALAAARPDLDLLGTDAYLFDENGIIGSYFHGDRTFPVEHQRAGMFYFCYLPSPAVRRASILESGGYDESLWHGTDWDLYIRMMLDGARAGCVDEPLYYYRRHGAQLTGNPVTSPNATLAMLEHYASDPRLDDRDRGQLERALRRHRLLRARAMMRTKAPGARSAAWGVARERAYPARTRMKAALAVIAPGIARRFAEPLAP